MMTYTLCQLKIGTYNNIATVRARSRLHMGCLGKYYIVSSCTGWGSSTYLGWGSQISQETPVISALNVFLHRRVSALPIVDAAGKPCATSHKRRRRLCQ